MAGKAGSHKHGSYAVTIAEDGAIKVNRGDWLSKYSAAIHKGDVSRVYDYGRERGGQLVPMDDIDRIVAGETIYHVPTHSLFHAKKSPQKEQSSAMQSVWIGVGGKSGARAIGGVDTTLAWVYNLGDPLNKVRYANITDSGASIPDWDRG